MAVTHAKPKRAAEATLFDLERVKGIEPSYAAWEAAVLPLNYTREGPVLHREFAALSSTGRVPCLLCVSGAALPPR